VQHLSKLRTERKLADLRNRSQSRLANHVLIRAVQRIRARKQREAEVKRKQLAQASAAAASAAVTAPPLVARAVPTAQPESSSTSDISRALAEAAEVVTRQPAAASRVSVSADRGPLPSKLVVHQPVAAASAAASDTAKISGQQAATPAVAAPAVMKSLTMSPPPLAKSMSAASFQGMNPFSSADAAFFKDVSVPLKDLSASLDMSFKVRAEYCVVTDITVVTF
jgi:hypothetical protein